MDFYVDKPSHTNSQKRYKEKFVSSPRLPPWTANDRGVAGGESIAHPWRSWTLEPNPWVVSLPLLPRKLSYHSSCSCCLLLRYPIHPGGMDGIPLGIGLGGTMDPLEAILGPFPCVRLRNLPHEATLEDVLVFFQGLVILDVILQGNGEAFVIFANPMDFQMALQRYVYDSFSLSRLARSCILYSSLFDQQ